MILYLRGACLLRSWETVELWQSTRSGSVKCWRMMSNETGRKNVWTYSVMGRHFAPIAMHDARLRQPGQYVIAMVEWKDDESLNQAGGCLFTENALHRFRTSKVHVNLEVKLLNYNCICAFNRCVYSVQPDVCRSALASSPITSRRSLGLLILHTYSTECI